MDTTANRHVQVVDRHSNHIHDHKLLHKIHEQNIEDRERDLHRTYHQDPVHLAQTRRDAQQNTGGFNEASYTERRAEQPARDAFEATVHQREDARGDIFDLETQQKRDYQRKLDEYHRFVSEVNY